MKACLILDQTYDELQFCKQTVIVLVLLSVSNTGLVQKQQDDHVGLRLCSYLIRFAFSLVPAISLKKFLGICFFWGGN